MFDDDEPAPPPVEPEPLPEPIIPDPGKEQTHGLDHEGGRIWLEREDR